MKITITIARYVVLDTLSKAGGWLDATALSQACGYTDSTAIYTVVSDLRQLGLIEAMKRRVDNHRTRVKLLAHWRLTEVGARVLDEYNSGRRVTGTTSVVELPPEPTLPSTPVSATPAMTIPDWLMSATPATQQTARKPELDETSATIRELEDEVLRLRALVEKYVPVITHVPGVGEVRLTREEAHTLLQQLLAASERE
jgi:hypothetical protein